jgi:ABC-type oligopeptide transport system substrate-binding subunit
MPFKSRIEKMTNKDFSMVFAGWGPDYNDPMTFLDMFETGNGNNHTSYSDADYDALLAKVRKEADAKTRDRVALPRASSLGHSGSSEMNQKRGGMMGGPMGPPPMGR